MARIRGKPFFASMDSALDEVVRVAKVNRLYKVSSHLEGCEGCAHVINEGWPTGLSCSGYSLDRDGCYMVVPADYRCEHWKQRTYY
jgi:hypothetical protein